MLEVRRFGEKKTPGLRVVFMSLQHLSGGNRSLGFYSCLIVRRSRYRCFRERVNPAAFISDLLNFNSFGRFPSVRCSCGASNHFIIISCPRTRDVKLLRFFIIRSSREIIEITVPPVDTVNELLYCQREKKHI